MEYRAGRLGLAAISHRLDSVSADDARDWILVAPSIGAQIAQELRRGRHSFLDGTGKLYLVSKGSSIHVDVRSGQKAERPPRTPVLAVGGLRVLFALLADPANLGATVRAIGERAGVSRHTVATALEALRSAGLLDRLGRSAHTWRPGRHAEALDLFTESWATMVRPTALQASLTTSRSTGEVEAELERELDGAGVRFAFGGSAGAYRLERFYRGATTVVHVEGPWRSEWNRALRAAPTREAGNVLVFAALGEEDFVADRRYAHPILLLAELARSPDPREREFATHLAAKLPTPETAP